MSPTASRGTRKSKPSKPPSTRLTSSERKTYTRKPVLPPPSLTESKKSINKMTNSEFDSYLKKVAKIAKKLKGGGNGSTIKKKSPDYEIEEKKKKYCKTHNNQ